MQGGWPRRCGQQPEKVGKGDWEEAEGRAGKQAAPGGEKERRSGVKMTEATGEKGREEELEKRRVEVGMQRRARWLVLCRGAR